MTVAWSGVLAAYGEIALKSKPVRRRFVERLISNINHALEAAGVKARVSHRWSRIIVETGDVERALRAVSRVFGLVYATSYRFVRLKELEGFISENAGQLLEGARSFAVRVRRTGKHQFTSLELERRIGSIIKARTGLKVSLRNPDRTVFLEVRGSECYVYTERLALPGGLPLSTAGRVVALMSTGIDSPVAAWLLMRRGCSIVVLHAQIHLEDEDPCLRKLRDIVEVLRSWHLGVDMPVYTYKHGESLAKLRTVASGYTCILCKRLMLKVAERIASEVGAKAIVTGENLAQVASQTLENLYAIDAAVDVPVLRPLIGFDKNEVIDLAKRVGTYEVGIRADPGCSPRSVCWAKPPKPVTGAKLEEVLRLEREVDMNSLVDEAYQTVAPVSD